MIVYWIPLAVLLIVFIWGSASISCDVVRLIASDHDGLLDNEGMFEVEPAAPLTLKELDVKHRGESNQLSTPGIKIGDQHFGEITKWEVKDSDGKVLKTGENGMLYFGNPDEKDR